MQLFELIEALEKEPKENIIKNGFSYPHSYRGYYEQLAFQPTKNVTVGEMLKAAKGAMNKTYVGYKGGKFKMHKYVDCWISDYGHASGETLGETLLEYMLNDYKKLKKVKKL